MFSPTPSHVKSAMNFVDRHPRLGWYIAVLVTLDFLGVDDVLSRLLG